MDGIKKLRCRKELGTWYYAKIVDTWKEVSPFYYLFDENHNFVDEFDTYQDIRDYIESHSQMC